jgi:hypothetical protein
VIVIGNGSVDGTAAAVRERHPGVDLIELGANRGAAARNVGMARAGTPYVAFADDDSWWAPGARASSAGRDRPVCSSALGPVAGEQHRTIVSPLEPGRRDPFEVWG